MKKYTVKVISPEYWQEIHDLLCEETACDHIPDRQVSCWDEKLHSPTRGLSYLQQIIQTHFPNPNQQQKDLRVM